MNRPAIKININFFLDFDFQPLYTFINCGFSYFEPQIHEKWKRENRNMATKKKAKKKSKKK